MNTEQKQATVFFPHGTSEASARRYMNERFPRNYWTWIDGVTQFTFIIFGNF